jgi:hypothetical protein
VTNLYKRKGFLPIIKHAIMPFGGSAVNTPPGRVGGALDTGLYGRMTTPHGVNYGVGTGQSKQSAAALWEMFYGPPQAGLQNVETMGEHARVNEQLPQYYVGKNLHLENLITHKIADMSDWVLTVFLPLVPYDGQHFTWSQLVHIPHVMDRVPEEATSRLITAKYEMQSASTERHGIAFRMEHGYMGTPEGIKRYQGNIQNILDAMRRTMELGAMRVLLQQRTYQDAIIDKECNASSDDYRIRKMLEVSTQSFGAIDKQYGADVLFGNMGRLFSPQIRPDMIIAPQGTLQKIHCKQATVDFYPNKALVTRYNLGDEGNPDAKKTLETAILKEQYSVYEHRGLAIGQVDYRDSNLVRQKEIGTFFTMDTPDHPGVLRGDGTSTPVCRDIKIIDHDNRRWVTINFINALRKSGCFDTSTPNGDLTDFGKKVLFWSDYNDNGDSKNTITKYTFTNLIQQYDDSVRTKYDHYLRGASGWNKRKTQVNISAQAGIGAVRTAPGKFANGEYSDLDFNKPIEQNSNIYKVENNLTMYNADYFHGKKLTNLTGWVTKLSERGNTIKTIFDNLRKLYLADVIKIDASDAKVKNSQALVEIVNKITGKIESEKKSKGNSGKANSRNDQITHDYKIDDDGGNNIFGAKVTLSHIQKLLNAGYDVPIKLYLMRPNMRFNMGAVAMAKGGAETGFTVFGNANFQLGDNPQDKTAHGHYTVYFNSIIHTPKNVMLAPDACFQGYLGGGGAVLERDPANYNPENNLMRESFASPSMYVKVASLDDPMTGPVPLAGWGSLPYLETMKNTCAGYLSGDMPGMDGVSKAYDELLANHAWQSWYHNVSGAVNSDGPQVEGMDRTNQYAYHDRTRGFNGLCFQGRQRNFHQSGFGSGDFSDDVRNRGHLGSTETEDASITTWSGTLSIAPHVVNVRDVKNM